MFKFFGEEDVHETMYVSCQECKHLVLEKDAQKISHRTDYDTSDFWNSTHWYCPQHKKQYSRSQIWCSSSVQDRAMKYFKEIEVDSEGTPIGYKKIKGKKNV